MNEMIFIASFGIYIVWALLIARYTEKEASDNI